MAVETTEGSEEGEDEESNEVCEVNDEGEEECIEIDSFYELGYESKFFIENLGTMFLMMAMFPVVLAALAIMYFLKNRYKKVDEVYTKIYNALFFNVILRFLLEGYLEFAIDALINVEGGNLVYDDITTGLSSVLAIIMTVVLILLPFIMWYILKKNFHRLREEAIEGKFGSIYEGLRHKPGSIYYNCYFVARRFGFAATAVFLPNYPFMQA